MDKKSKSHRMHKQKRGNNPIWVFLLVGMLVLFLGAILIFLMVSSEPDEPTMVEVSRMSSTSQSDGAILPAHFTERKITDSVSAKAAINDVAEVLGITSVDDELGAVECSTVLGDTYYSFQQMYQKIPVYGRKVIVSSDADSDAALLSSGFYPIENLSIEPKITKEDAKRIVVGLYSDDAVVHVGNLVIFSLSDTEPELTWSVSVKEKASMETVFVSAIDGKIIEAFSNNLEESEADDGCFTNVFFYDAAYQDVDTDKTTLEVISNGRIVATYDQDDEFISLDGCRYIASGGWNHIKLTDENGEVYEKICKGNISIYTKSEKLKPVDIDLLNTKTISPAYVKILAASNFYRDVLKYDAFGDENRALALVINNSNNGDPQNAWSACGESGIFALISIGSKRSPTIDVLGHEYTHAVAQSISRLNYKGESGALAEAYGDIFGEIIEDWYNDSPKIVYRDIFRHWDTPVESSLKWLDGDVAWSMGMNERNLATPQTNGLPVTYCGENWHDTENSKDDHGGVHANSTVISHAAYLMTQPSVDETKYESLSTYDLAQLFYKALYGISKSDTNFSEFRNVLTYTAYSMCQTGMLTAKQVAMVDWAMGTKVGIPNSLFLDENENSIVSIDGQAKLYVYADDGTLCDNYDLRITRLDTDTLPVEYDENLPRTVSYDYSVRKSDAFQIDLTPGNYEFVLTDPSGQEPSEIEYLRVLEHNGLKGYPFYPGFKNSNDHPFEPIGEHQYKIFYDTLTWEEAKAACEAMGGHLATVTSEEEQQKLNLYNAGNHKLWIGGYKNTEGQWCWVTGEPWKYENWGDGEPNNSSNVVAGESCVAMWPEKWNDLANSNVYEQSGYICEWEASDNENGTKDDGYTGHCYEIDSIPESEWESGPITWEQAERRCEWKGGHLAVIESQAENDCLYNMMKEKGYENACFGYSDKEKEGDWKWVNGSQSAYTNWHSGEPNNQGGDENYAMFYQKFGDGTWNDGSGIIDADCAYICEWDDPADRQQGDTFTDKQLRIIARDLGVPDGLDVKITQSPKTYWEPAGIWDIYVEITLGEKVIASGSFDVETGEMGRNLYIYSPNQ
ncbi:lectin-like protein [Faecalibacterium prausnitzii]|uniref:Thermostable neutral protease NprT n=1 Tax=Faecalibacterium prausnitzii TaxID=853 RepID=A0A564TE39_9FIRM|nr:lectin-like protein [Faecalibacterium prausnitzii]VUX05690.1 Thermostable neutral protease NprT [Faecalibacterium prausnitzii]